MRLLDLLTSGLLVAALAGSALGGPARQYRGPEGQSPRGVAPPGMGDLAGLERLSSASRQVEGLDRWEFWWEVNRGVFLRPALDARYEARQVPPAVKVFAGMAPLAANTDASDVRDRILPVLLEQVRGGLPSHRVAAALALGRSRHPGAFKPLLSLLSDGRPGIRRTAALGLGLLGEPMAASPLLELLGRAGMPARERAYFAVALGMLRSREAGPVLAGILRESGGVAGRGVEELQAACATALGLIGDRTYAPLLRRIATERANRPEMLRASALISLGRLMDPGAVPVAIRMLGDNRVAVRRAAAQALRKLEDRVSLAALEAAFSGDPDPHVRGLSALAMGTIGGQGVGDLLEDSLTPACPRALRGFVAIALGLLGEHRRAATLRALVESRGEKSVRGAAAIGLGLLGDVSSAPSLRGIALDGAEDDDLRGYAVTALGLLGDSRIARRLPVLAREKGSADLRRAATLAIGLYPDLPGSRTCLASLFEETDPFVRGAALNSLALSSRRSTVDTVLSVARSRGFPVQARTDALTALGVLAARGGVSNAEGLVEGASYRTQRGALADALRLF